MDIKDIRSFMECYETRSINKAARSLYITPQGLGKILDRLEHELQIQLFDRTKQGLVPTEAGVFFYKKSQSILDSATEIEQGIDALRRKETVFNIGYSCGLIRLLSMDKIDRLQEKLGNIQLVLEEASNQDVKTKLIKEQVDVALVIGRVAAAGFEEVEISSKKMCAVVPKGHSLFEKESISLRELEHEQLISLNEKYQSYNNLINSCEREGFFPDIRIKTMEAFMIYAFVRQGLGLGIDVDIHEKELLGDDLKLIPIEDAIPWSVYVAFTKEKTKDKRVQLFLETIK